MLRIRQHTTQAFSLVELSIVLVILGLLTGGILAGQSLIHAAELRGTIEQIKKLDVAHNAFKDKYLCLAGDCSNATAFGWTAPESTCGANGDNNGRLDGRCEIFNSIGYLGALQFIEATEKNMAYVQGGISVRPKMTAIGSDGYQGYWWTQYNSTVTNGSTPEGHYYWLTTSPTGGPSGARVLGVQDSWAMDTKIDDGLPRTGNIRAAGSGTVTTATFYKVPTFVAAADATAAAGASNPQCVTSALEYNLLNNSNSICSLTIKTGF